MLTIASELKIVNREKSGNLWKQNSLKENEIIKFRIDNFLNIFKITCYGKTD